MNFQPNKLSEFQPNYMDAVNSLAGGKHTICSSTGHVPTVWKEGATDLPTEEEIQTEIVRLKAVWDAQEYARNRAPAYPSTGDQLDMIYKDTKNSTTTHADAVEAVKTKWPKDGSGPVE